MKGSNYFDYTRIEKIGEGAYGHVYKVLHNPTGRIFAMKQVTTDQNEEGIPQTALREVSILRELDHPNVVKLYEVIVFEHRLALVLEHMASDMGSYLQSLQSHRLPPDELQSYFYQLCQVLYFVHRKGIAHRDLKPQNLLIDRNGLVKLADFGLGRNIGIPIRAYTAEVVTLYYRPPEILLGEMRYCSSVDIWSAACVFAELATGSVLFKGDSEIDQLCRIFRVLSTPTELSYPKLYAKFLPRFPIWTENRLASHVPQLDHQGLLLLQEMLRYDPTKRITAREIIRHPYFSSLDKSRLPDYVAINRCGTQFTTNHSF
ncbi:unnamed protein product [Nesidiocoris tenuis]|uniref:S_TKc n=2 Tax=Nesidiocoris tenuis TaxID=355587 RepID=A0ABN7BFT4_9HEMI|nr:S_TKc [Nesidiocoris tenuis]CAB0008532.1 unnamed protein product [Nesidiocoris tenuis]